MAHLHLPRPRPSEVAGRTPPRPSGRLLRGRKLRILAATASAGLLLAGAAACGDTVASTAPKSSPTPKEAFVPAQLAAAWKTPAAEGSLDRTLLLETWQTKTAFYVGRGTGVEILDPATGKKTGTIAPPEPGMQPCAMTKALTADGLGAIAWVKGDPQSVGASCDRVSLVDTRNGGSITWTKQVSGAPLDGKPLTNDGMRLGFVAGDVLAVMTPNTIVGMRRDGAEAWTWRNPGVQANQYVLNWDMTVHNDRIMVMIGIESGDWRYWTTVLDAAGKELSPEPVPMSVPKGAKIDLVDAAMAVLLRPRAADKATKPELVTFTREGSLGRVIPLASNAGPLQENWSNRLGSHDQYDIAFSGSTAYFVAGDTLSTTNPTQVIAIDLGSGATKWTQPVDIGAVPRFLGTDADKLYVLGGRAIRDMNVYAYSVQGGAKTKVSTVKVPDGGVSMSGTAVDYNAGSIALTEASRGSFGTIMFRAP